MARVNEGWRVRLRRFLGLNGNRRRKPPLFRARLTAVSLLALTLAAFNTTRKYK